MDNLTASIRLHLQKESIQCIGTFTLICIRLKLTMAQSEIPIDPMSEA